MKTEMLDLTVLPSKARLEIKDFYQFLLQKYTQKSGKGVKEEKLDNLLPKKISAFKPLKRDDVYEQ